MDAKLQQLKPQDVIIALKLVLLSDSSWKMTEVADDLCISQSEVSMGLERLRKAKLVDSEKNMP